MIDLHCHILPQVDDGAMDLEDAVAMGRQADADGIGLICATPHIRHDHEVEIADLGPRVVSLNDALAAHGVEARVAIGGEVAEGAVDELSDGELRAITLGGGGRWILLEPAPGALSESLLGAIDALATRGFRTIVAHPERHLDGQSPELLGAAVTRGALVQATVEDFLIPGSQLLDAMAARGLVHVLGSDSHSSRFGRPVRLSAGVGALATVPELAPHLGWIAHAAPEAIVRGEDLEPPYAVT